MEAIAESGLRQAGAQWAASDQPDRRALQGRQSARSLLLTVLGEYVLARGCPIWTSTVLEALALFGVEDKAARQALARAAKAGWLTGERVGRLARWHLTDQGKLLLAQGTARIYAFDPARSQWDGKWLLVVISVPEERRADRHVLRTRLAWSGFGSLGQGVWLSPDTTRRAEIESIFEGLSRPTREVAFIAEIAEPNDPAVLLHEVWDLSELAERYVAFITEFASSTWTDPALAFTVRTRLVHEWRKFPFIDPGLPTVLLPADWPGNRAHELFRGLHRDTLPGADAWFDATQRRADLRYTSAR